LQQQNTPDGNPSGVFCCYVSLHLPEFGVIFSKAKITVSIEKPLNVIPAFAGIYRFLWIPDNFLLKFPK